MPQSVTAPLASDYGRGLGKPDRVGESEVPGVRRATILVEIRIHF